MTPNRFKKIAEKLTPMQKALLFYWNCSKGKILESGKRKEIYSRRELQELIDSMDKSECFEFSKCEEMVFSIPYYDQLGFGYYQSAIILINEISLIIEEHENRSSETLENVKRYSVLLNKETGIAESANMMIAELQKFFSILVFIFIHLYILKDRFYQNDLLTIQSLKNIFRLKNYYRGQKKDIIFDSADPYLKEIFFNKFINYVRKSFSKVVNDSIGSFEEAYPNIGCDSSEYDEIKKYIYKNLNEYFPDLLTIEKEKQKQSELLFDEIIRRDLPT